MTTTTTAGIGIGKDFILAGNATFTVENGKGSHYTFKIRKGSDWGRGVPYFASVLTGPDNESGFSYAGILNLSSGEVCPTAKSKVLPPAPSFRVLSWSLRKVWKNEPLPEGYLIRHSGTCGRCGRTLTHPESLDSGIGPECRKALGSWS